MKSEAMRVAVAELCGWKQDEIPTVQFQSDSPVKLWKGPQGEIWAHGQLPPDFCDDLDTMHEAEHNLFIHKGSTDYYEQLGIICTRDACSFSDYSDPRFWSDSRHATALQRCEAFLRTHGKYVEDGK